MYWSCLYTLNSKLTLLFYVLMMMTFLTDNICQSNPCYNGGTCEESSTSMSGFECFCKGDNFGERCQGTLDGGEFRIP